MDIKITFKDGSLRYFNALYYNIQDHFIDFTYDTHNTKYHISCIQKLKINNLPINMDEINKNLEKPENNHDKFDINIVIKNLKQKEESDNCLYDYEYSENGELIYKEEKWY